MSEESSALPLLLGCIGVVAAYVLMGGAKAAVATTSPVVVTTSPVRGGDPPFQIPSGTTPTPAATTRVVTTMPSGTTWAPAATTRVVTTMPSGTMVATTRAVPTGPVPAVESPSATIASPGPAAVTSSTQLVASHVPAVQSATTYEPDRRAAPSRAVVWDGLVAHVAAASYAGSGTLVPNLVSSTPARLEGRCELVTMASKRAIHFVNDDEPRKNTSRLVMPAASVHSIVMWIYIGTVQNDMRFLFDGRPNGEYMTNKAPNVTGDIVRGAVYVNGERKDVGDVMAVLTSTTPSWCHLAIVMAKPTADVALTLFARHSGDEGYDVYMGSVLVYDRALSAEEVRDKHAASF